MNNENLRCCPCGEIPTKLYTSDIRDRNKWINVSGNCCGKWTVEFKASYHSDESMKLAIEAVDAWNKAPRGINA